MFDVKRLFTLVCVLAVGLPTLNCSSAALPDTAEPQSQSETEMRTTTGALSFDSLTPEKLTSPEQHDANLGWGVAADGDTVALGAAGEQNPNETRGAVYLYERGSNGWTGPTQKLMPDDGTDERLFGGTIAIDGDTMIVGSYGNNQSQAAYVFRKQPSGHWQKEARLTPDLAPESYPGGRFGIHVELDGDTAIVGADKQSRATPDGTKIFLGAAYIFERQQGSWSQTQRLRAPNPTEKDHYGTAVALEGNLAVVGSKGLESGGGTAYIYRDSGSEFVLEAQKDAPNGGKFSESVEVEKNTVVVGAWAEGNQFGAVYAYSYNGQSWTSRTRLVPTDLTTKDAFGYAIDMEDDTLVVGAPQVGSLDPGSAYVFSRDSQGWNQPTNLSPPSGGATPGDQFGQDLAFDENTTAVGALFEDHDGFRNPGAGYVYTAPTNSAPDAVCEAQTVAAGQSCSACPSIDGGSTDPDGDSLTLSQSPECVSTLGTHEAELTATDPEGASDMCSASITLVDESAPQISVANSRVEIWSPNHKCQTFDPVSECGISVSDNCSGAGAVSVRPIEVSSDEAHEVNGGGDGHHSDDMELLADGGVKLRAERQGGGNGRVYTVTVEATDGSGNSSTAQCQFVVPKSQSPQHNAIDDGPAVSCSEGSDCVCADSPNGGGNSGGHGSH